MKNIGYKKFTEWEWKTFSGENVNIDDFLNTNKNDDFFYIGTDSKSVSGHSYFTTAIVAYKKGIGGKILIHKNVINKIDNIRQRLLIEAMMSLECAWYINTIVSNSSIIHIHLDINSNLKFPSAHYKEELIGLIVSQGFNVKNKPYAWAATVVAHSKCK